MLRVWENMYLKNIKRMNILVTGGRGQLGCALRKVSHNYPDLKLFLTDMPEADITDKSGISKLAESLKADMIINCAAYTAVDKAEAEADLARKINTDGARVLAEVCREKGIPLIQISTDYVFDGNSNQPLKEEDPANTPLGVYGKTKRDGEIAVAESGCHAAIVRTAWLYSEFGSNFVKTMLRLAESRHELGVVYDQLGTPTYAPDLAEAILDLATQGITGCEIYHYTDEGTCSWYDFAHEIFDLAHVRMKLNAIETRQYPTPAQRPRYSVLDKGKIKAKGIKVPHWRDSLRKCIAELRKESL